MSFEEEQAAVSAIAAAVESFDDEARRRVLARAIADVEHDLPALSALLELQTQGSGIDREAVRALVDAPSSRELHEAWYKFAQRAADAVITRVDEAFARPRPPVEITVRLHGPIVDAAVAAAPAPKKRKAAARRKR